MYFFFHFEGLSPLRLVLISFKQRPDWRVSDWIRWTVSREKYQLRDWPKSWTCSQSFLLLNAWLLLGREWCFRVLQCAFRIHGVVEILRVQILTAVWFQAKDVAPGEGFERYATDRPKSFYIVPLESYSQWI